MKGCFPLFSQKCLIPNICWAISFITGCIQLSLLLLKSKYPFGYILPCPFFQCCTQLSFFPLPCCSSSLTVAMLCGLDLVESKCFSWFAQQECAAGSQLWFWKVLSLRRCYKASLWRSALLNQGQYRVLLPQPSSDLPLLTVHSFIYLVKLVFVYAYVYGFLNFACFPTVLWRQEFGDKIISFPPNMWNPWNSMFYDCSLCFTVAMYIFVVRLVPLLLVEKNTKSIKPLTGLCRIWDYQNISNSLRINLSTGMWPLVFCRGSKKMQGRRVLTAGEAHGAERLGIVLLVWGSRTFMECGPCLLTWWRSPLCKWKGYLWLLQAGNRNIHLTLYTSRCEGLISGNKWQ